MRRLGLIILASLVFGLSLFVAGRLADAHRRAQAHGAHTGNRDDGNAGLTAAGRRQLVRSRHELTSTAPAAPGIRTTRAMPSPTPQGLAATAVEATPAPTHAPTREALALPKPKALATKTVASPVRASESMPSLQEPAVAGPFPLSLGWLYSSNGHLTAAGVWNGNSGPVYYVSSLGRRVDALDATGHLLWRARTAGPAYALAVLGPSRVVVGDDAGEVTLLNRRGRAEWRHQLASRVTALAGAWHGCVLAGGWDERLSCLSIAQDSERVSWQAGLGSPLGDIALLPDLALAATLDGSIRAFDPAGVEKWHTDVGSEIVSLGTVEAEGAPIVLISLQSGRLLALDAGGRERWRLQLDGDAEGSPVWHAADVAGDTRQELIVGLGGRRPLLALVSTEGTALWRVALPSAVNSVAAVDLNGDGNLDILAGLSSGEIWAFDAAGRQRGSVHAGLQVWGLHTTEAGPVLALADVVARQIRGTSGPTGEPWFNVPELLPDPTSPALSRPAGPAPPDERNGDASSGSASDTASEVTLVFLGDVAPGRSMESQLARYGPAYPWRGLEGLVGSADLAVANLECVLSTEGQSLDKPYVIRSHPRWSGMLAEAGFDLVTLANNHSLDYGREGLDGTMEALQGAGIVAIGAGRSRNEAHQPALFTIGDVRVAVLGYAANRWYGSEDIPATDQLAWARPERVQADVEAVRDQADYVVVLLHAGTEYATKPSTDQVTFAREAVRAGADLVVGHHPHVTQTVEQYRGGLIVYSLGDALFDIPRQAAMRGHLLRVQITQDGLERAELWPFWIHDTIQPRLLDDGQEAPRVRVVYP